MNFECKTMAAADYFAATICHGDYHRVEYDSGPALRLLTHSGVHLEAAGDKDGAVIIVDYPRAPWELIEARNGLKMSEWPTEDCFSFVVYADAVSFCETISLPVQSDADPFDLGLYDVLGHVYGQGWTNNPDPKFREQLTEFCTRAKDMFAVTGTATDARFRWLNAQRDRNGAAS